MTTDTAPGPIHKNFFEAIEDAVATAADSALHFLKEVSDDWSAIKQNPVYGSLVQLGSTAIMSEMAAQGIPVPALVNVGSALVSALDAAAAMHPAIKTP